MSNTVVYGGTFNPIHRGHTALIRAVLADSRYDRLLLVPAAQPPHKDAPQLADAGNRLAMCALATAEIPCVELLDWEIAQGGKSYTVDTLEYLRQAYPDDSFFLLIGTDMFLSFDKWRAWRRIGELAPLLVASRERDDTDAFARQQALLEAAGVHVRLLSNTVLPLSSTQVREELVQSGRSAGLEPAVEDYCRTRGLYGLPYDLEGLRALVKPLLNASRYRHCLCVEQRAAHLAGLFGCDVNKAAAAGILHDICKNMPDADLLQMLACCGTITLYGIDFARQPQLLHSHAGAVYLRETVGITDDDLLNAVRFHTTARAGMSLLEQVVYLADLTSAERDYPDAAYLRDLSEHSLHEGMRYALDYLVERHLKQTGEPVCDDTMQAYSEYRSERIQEDLE